MTVVNASPSKLRYRRSGATWLASVLALVFVFPFVGGVFVELDGVGRAILLPVAGVAVLIPLAVAVWSLRSGVDVNADGLTVRALVGRRVVPWSRVTGFDASTPTVYALLEGGSRLVLPAVRQVDLPQLLAVGGRELVSDDAGSAETPAGETEPAEAH